MSHMSLFHRITGTSLAKADDVHSLGVACVVLGEPGIGKSTFLRRIVANEMQESSVIFTNGMPDMWHLGMDLIVVDPDMPPSRIVRPRTSSSFIVSCHTPRRPHTKMVEHVFDIVIWLRRNGEKRMLSVEKNRYSDLMDRKFEFRLNGNFFELVDE